MDASSPANLICRGFYLLGLKIALFDDHNEMKGNRNFAGNYAYIFRVEVLFK
jgi:hypothetical protein